ncbi:hypothetical protein UlMin_029869 [Ulmus minor]
MGLKIDLQKAYDRLSWDFLEAVLRAYGFHSQWIHWVILCCSSVHMTLILNGAPFKSFKSKRGPRQGDPISPYLFIICMEVLSRSINKKVDEGLIKGFRLNRHLLTLHHPFFANDVFLIGKCSVNKSFYFKECLDEFCHWSGQSFNPQNLRDGKKKPSLELRSLSFWWNTNSNNGKTLCLRAWDDLCKPKACGGLGFQKMMDFNKALLAKWSWNLLVGNRSLCLDTLWSRYLHSTNFSDATPSRGDSCFWKAILQIRCLLNDGVCYVVGDGCSIDPWKDPWVPNNYQL